MGLAIVDRLDSMMGYHWVSSGGSSSQQCPSGTCVVANSMKEKEVPQYLDCIIVLDNSGSIGKTEFIQAKEAAKVTKTKFCVGIINMNHIIKMQF